MSYIIIGNIIALVASILMVYSGIIKNKKKIIYVQTIQISLSVLSNIILNGITGAIINVLSLIRNILCYKDKLKLKTKIIISLLAIIFSLKFNNIGLIGLLPLISMITYIWLMNIKNVIHFKILIIFTMIMWGIYDLYIKSYTSAIFDFASVITNYISIIQINRKNNKNT